MPIISNLTRHQRLALRIGLGAAILAGVAMLAAGTSGYRRHARQVIALQHLNARLAGLPARDDHQAASAELAEVAARAQALGRPLPAADYNRLWHEWQATVRDFRRINAALSNRYLAAEQRQRLQTFHEGLLALRDRCAAALEAGGPQPAPLGWKLHNLKGNWSVLLAYSVLDFEQDGRKAAKFLSDAVDDYKAAIELVDRTCGAPLDLAVPRWNLELIVGIGEYRRIGLSDIPRENMTEVKQQLEAHIPDVAGFAPGVPLETRVEK